jgi:hypothetical protein
LKTLLAYVLHIKIAILSSLHFPGLCRTHSDCANGETCILKPTSDQSGKFTYDCVREQQDEGDKGGLHKMTEVEENEEVSNREEEVDRPQSKKKLG